MKILLATASADDAHWASAHGLIDGIVTTPTLIASERPEGNGRDLIGTLARRAGLPVYASVESVSADDIYQDGRDLARLADQVVVCIPLLDDALGAIRRLSSEGIRVAAALVFGTAQGVLAAKTGARSVTVSLDQLDAIGLDGVEIVRELRTVFEAIGAECEVIAALPRDATQFTNCALAGADAIVVTIEVLRSLLVHPLTDRGVDQFLHELSRRPRPRAAT